MKVFRQWMLIFSVVVFIAGCSSTNKKTDGFGGSDAVTSGYSGDGEIQDERLGDLEDITNGSLMGGEFNNPDSLLSKSVIYFMFDSSEVQPVFAEVVTAHAQYLVEHSSQRVVLEGHADERGSPEYNVALSERRAKAVARMFEMQGVLPEQIEIISYGEMKPSEEGHDQAAWQLNRRVEITYQAQS